MDQRRAGALLALAACIACSAAAPTASNQTSLDLYDGAPEGCYYNFQHYGEGDRIMTNEPCLNCTCHNRMLMCYLRVCPFTKPIGQDCTIEKRADQCCPIVTCPDVPVDLLTSTSTSSPAEYGATGLGKVDKYGCSINGKYFPEGSKVPPTPNKPCEHCYCIRNMTTCVMQECTLHVDGCTPIYHKDVCCPVRYSCDHPDDEMLLLDDMSTTVRPTPGFLLTTTTISPVTQITQDCVHDDQIFADGALIKTEKACEHCYCMKGDIVCVVQECGTPMENEGKNCTSLPPREGQCCPDTYICEGDELSTEVPTELPTESMFDKLTTLLPPRRSGVEGSGYRNEPDEVSYTPIPTSSSEHEGSGEEQITMRPFDSEKPTITEEIHSTSEDSDKYIPYTTKSPFEEPVDTTETDIEEMDLPAEEGGTVEPQEYIPATTNIYTGKDDEKVSTESYQEQTVVSEHEDTDIDQHVPTAPASESHGEILTNTAEMIPIKESAEPHLQKTTSTFTTLEDYERTTPSNKEEYSTVKGISQEGGEQEDFSSATSASEIEEPIKELASTTESEISDSEEPISSTPRISSVDKTEKVTSTLHDITTSSYVVHRVEPEQHVTGTVPNEYEATTVPDHAQNTVIDTEADDIHPHEQSITPVKTSEEESTTLHYLELGSGDEDIEIDRIEPHGHSSTEAPAQIESVITTIEPDKGLNTIPSETIEESSSEASLPERTTLSHDISVTEYTDGSRSTEYKIITTESTTSSSKGDQFTITTEPSFRKEDESSVSTEKSKEQEVTTAKLDFTDEGFIPTVIHDQKLSTGSVIPSAEEFTTMFPDHVIEHKEPTTELFMESSVSSEIDHESIPDVTTERVIPTPSKQFTSEDEVHAYEETGRIPGEGDCLLNGITYRNNSSVPSNNNCHSGCKCFSSIIKCDPIICSPPPDYMANCQSIYDSPESCCPTYICDHPRETVPPQSDNQMSGTESPLPSPAIECRGDQCEMTTDEKKPGTKPEISQCGRGDCDDTIQQPIIPQFPIEHPDECKDGKCQLPSDCANGECKIPPTQDQLCDPEHGCQAVPVKPCEGEHCETKHQDNVPHAPQLCNDKEYCKDLQTAPCEGDSCISDCGTAGCDTNIEQSPHDIQQESCKDGDCKPQQPTGPECTEESCRRTEIPNIAEKVPGCEGSECTQSEIISDSDILNTESPVETSKPSEEGTQYMVTIEEELLTTLKQDTITEKSTGVTNIPESEDSSTKEVPHDGSDHIAPQKERPPHVPESSTAADRDSTVPSSESELPENYPEDIERTPEVTDKTDRPQVSKTEKMDTEGFEQDASLGSTEPSRTSFEKVTTTHSDSLVEISTLAQITPSEKERVTGVEEDYTEIPSRSPGVETQTDQAVTAGLATIGGEEPVSGTKMPDSFVTTEFVGIGSIDHKPEVYTDIPESGLPHTKPEVTGPVSIEPQEGEEESTIMGALPGFVTEKENIDTERPELQATKISDEKDKTTQPEQLAEIPIKKPSESPELFNEQPEQPISEVPVHISTQEHVTQISVSSATESETSFTEIEDGSVTGQEDVTTEKSIYGEKITTEHFDKSTERIEPFTFEGENEILEMSSPSSDKPFSPDSMTQEVSTKATVITGDEQIFTEMSPSDVSDTVEQVTDIYKSPVTEIHETFTESPMAIITESKEITGKPIDTISQEEKTTKYPDIEENLIYLTTKAPEESGVEKQGIDEEKPELHVTVPQEDYSKVPDEFSTESYDSEIQEIVTKRPYTIIEQKITTVPEIIPGSDESTQKEPTSDVQKSSTDSIETEILTEKPALYSTSIAPESIVTQFQLTTETLQGPEESVSEITIHKETATKIPEDTEISKPEVTQSVDLDMKAPEEIGGPESTKAPEQEMIVTKTPDTKVSETDTTEQVESVTKISEDKKTPETDITEQEEYVTKAPGDTKVSESEINTQEDIATKAPEKTKVPQTEVADQEGIVTKTPEDNKVSEAGVTIQEDIVTKVPEDTKSSETEVTEQEDNVTKAPEDIKTSEAEITEQEDIATKTPEVSFETGVTEQEVIVTKAPEVTRTSESEVILQEDIITKAPEDTTAFEVEVIGQEDITTKAPEDTKAPEPDVIEPQDVVTKAPEDTKASKDNFTVHEDSVTKTPADALAPEVTAQEDRVTKAPEDTKASETEITGQEGIVTKSPEDTKLPEDVVTNLEDIVTKSPEITKGSESDDTVTNAPDTSEIEVTKQEGIVTQMPEYTKSPEGTEQEDENAQTTETEMTEQKDTVTKAPEDTKTSEAELTEHEHIVTKAPEDIKSPEIEIQEEIITKAPEDITESETEVTESEGKVTKAPEDTKVSEVEITGQEDVVTNAPEYSRVPEKDVIGQEEIATKAPDDIKASEPEINLQEGIPVHVGIIPNVPEDTKIPQIAVTEQEDIVTKSPEVITVPEFEITGQEYTVTKAPEVTKAHETEITGQKDIVTEAEVTVPEDIATKAPEYTKAPEVEITGQEDIVTKAPEDTKISEAEVTGHEDITTKVPEAEVTGQEEIVKTPEDTKAPETEVTGQKDIVTNAPEAEVTGQEDIVTKAPEDTKVPETEITGQKDIVTKAPEAEVTGLEDIVTKTPEVEVTAQEDIVTKTPEALVTGQEDIVTKAPEDTKAPETEFTGQKDIITKTPETEVIGQEDTVTKAPEDTKAPETELTGQKDIVTKTPETQVIGQEDIVTKAPETELTEQKDIVTKTPEAEVTEQEDIVTKTPEVEVTGQEDIVTKTPEAEVTGQEDIVTKTPEVEVTGQEDIVTNIPEAEVTGQEDIVTKAPENEVTGQQDIVTKTPEADVTRQEDIVTKTPEAEVTGHKDIVTKAPEVEVTGQEDIVTKIPEDAMVPEAEVSGQKDIVTKAPEVEVTGQEDIVTKAPEVEVTGQEDIVTKAPEAEVTGQEDIVTKAPEVEVTRQEDIVTKAPEVEVTGQEDIVTKTPEAEVTGQKDIVTKAPEVEVTGQEDIGTKTPEVEVTGQEDIVTKTPEVEVTEQKDILAKAPETEETEQEGISTKVPETEVTVQKVTKAPETEVIGQEDIVTKAPEVEVTGQEDIVTKTPEVEVTGHKDIVTKAPEVEVTGQEDIVTKAPETEVIGQKDIVTKVPEVEVTGQENIVTKAPEVEVTGQEDIVTKVPEVEVTEQGDIVTKTPEVEVTGQEYIVTKTPEVEVTGQEDIVTKTPEVKVTGLEDIVTKAPEVEATGQENIVTKTPEAEFTGQEDNVTKAPEVEVTGQEDIVTRIPEDAMVPEAEVSGQEDTVTKAPESDSTRQEDIITKAPETEVTGQEDIVTKMPETEVTGSKDIVTEAPEDTKTPVDKVTEHEDIVTKAPEYAEVSEPEATKPQKQTTITPEKTEQEATEVVPGDLVTDKQVTTPALQDGTTIKEYESVTKATEQPSYEFSQTTPEVVILEEFPHTHKIVEEVSTISPSDEERITVSLEAGQQVAVSEQVTEKEHEEHIDSVTKEIESTTHKINEEISRATYPPVSQITLSTSEETSQKIPEALLTEETPADKNNEDTKDKDISTAKPTSLTEESTLPTGFDSQKSPIPEIEVSVETEKLPSSTENPQYHETAHETTAAGEELAIITSTKATTTKQEEEIATTSTVDKFTKPEEKPSEIKPETPKPITGETQPTDELPPPEEDGHFPPSGMSGYGEPDYVEEDQAFGPGTCRYGGKVYVSAQQIPRDDPCDFCFCFRSDIICLQQSCPPPIHGCHEEPIQGFCCPRYECPVSMATTVNVTTTTTTTTTTLPPHFPTHSYKGAAQRRGCQIKGHTYKVGDVVRSSSGPCLHCTCGGDGQMKCDPKACTPEPMLRQMIAAAVSAKRRR